MAEGLSPCFYNHFLVLLWGDGSSAYLSKADSSADSEWESFCSVIRLLCRKSNHLFQISSDSASHSSWEFLIKSRYHDKYCKHNFIAATFSRTSSGMQVTSSSGAVVGYPQRTEESFYMKLLTETLDSLHAVYETLKLDNLRKRFITYPIIFLFISIHCILQFLTMIKQLAQLSSHIIALHLRASTLSKQAKDQKIHILIFFCT